MKKYIQPIIEVCQPDLILLAGLSKTDGQGNEGDYFTNENLFDAKDETLVPKDQDLWEE